MDATTDHDDPTRHIPARMLNEWTYCPRLAILEWVYGEWEDNADTIDGRWKHRRVDRPGPPLPPPEPGDPVQLATRSVWLSSDHEGLTARIDLVEMGLPGLDGDEVVVVDTKRGNLPPPDIKVWEPERVQLCAQALVLRDHGYRCDRGFVWFADARQRVEVLFDEDLVLRTRQLAGELRSAAREGTLPAPLDDSPKCPRCSLVGICLPDETNALVRCAPEGEPVTHRQLLAPEPHRLPLHVATQGARLGKHKDQFEITLEGEKPARVPIRECSQLGLFGRIMVTPSAMQEAMSHGIPVCYYSFGGWFYGLAQGMTHKNVVLREAQFATAADPARRLAVARAIVQGKIRNQRVLLRRNGGELPVFVLAELKRLSEAAAAADDVDTLLGLEGAAARLYFQHLGGCLRGTDEGAPAFEWTSRNRRPPRDPVNAMLSFAYARLTADATVALLAAGFDPYMGFYHRPRYGRPALALDLMEEFRPLVADSVVLTAVNNGELHARDFVARAHGVNLTDAGRKSFLACYERRMDQQLTHPLFGYKVTWRRLLEVQARLLGRHVLGEIPRYVPIETR